VKEIDAVVLSHAHIDHSGALPCSKAGLRRPIFATHATRDLCAAMLDDAAIIQEADARFLNKQIDRGARHASGSTRSTPRRTPWRRWSASSRSPTTAPFEVAPGVRVTFLDAGHVLGSAITALDIDEDGRTRRWCSPATSGAPTCPSSATRRWSPARTLLITESTYGDRLHDPIAKMDDDLAESSSAPSPAAAR
jgi:metallo-beta-lactamase family protein